MLYKVFARKTIRFKNTLFFQRIMVIIQHQPKRKPTGGRYKNRPTKRLNRMGREPMLTKLGERSLKIIKAKGGNIKQKLAHEKTVNLYNPKTKKCSKALIKQIIETPADPHFARRNIMVKGTIIVTEVGKARITNRPGQEGSINAVLIE